MRRNRKEFQSPGSFSRSQSAEEEGEPEGNPFGMSEEDEAREPRRRRGRKQTSMDFKVAIPEFEGQLNPDEFLDWMSTVKRVFEYKDILDDKKVKLVFLKLRRYVSIWWNNILSKRARKGKPRSGHGGR